MIAEKLKGNVIGLEGYELIAVKLGHTDTYHTTCLNVASIGLVVAGDEAAYNDVHLYLVESNSQTRREWISALDKIESLNPRAVVASRKRPAKDDNPRITEETWQYIRDFDSLAETIRTAQELYDKMLKLYPNRGNPGGRPGVRLAQSTVIYELSTSCVYVSHQHAQMLYRFSSISLAAFQIYANLYHIFLRLYF